MKKVGIIFAMDEEIQEFQKLIEIYTKKDIYDLHFYETTINNTNCIFVTCIF